MANNPDYTRPYVDSSVFIAWLNREASRFEIADQLIKRAENGDYPIYISALTLAEVNKIPRSKTAPLTPEKNEMIIKFFQHDFFKVLPVDRAIGEAANRFCREYRIMGNDAIHLACALRAKCDVLLAWDRPLSKNVNHPDIRVEEPEFRGQLVLTGQATASEAADEGTSEEEATEPPPSEEEPLEPADDAESGREG